MKFMGRGLSAGKSISLNPEEMDSSTLPGECSHTLTSSVHSCSRLLQRFKLCSGFTQLGTYHLPKRSLQVVQLVDRTPQVVRQQLPHVRIRVDRQMVVSVTFFVLSRIGFSFFCVTVLANPSIDSQILIGNRRIYVDNRLHTLLDIKFNEPFFERGQFPEVIYDGPNPVALQNPWINGTNATPFDQGKFY